MTTQKMTVRKPQIDLINIASPSTDNLNSVSRDKSQFAQQFTGAK